MKSFLRNTRRYIGRNVFHFKCSDFLKDTETGLYVEDYFHEMVYLERRRAERSARQFVLVLVDFEAVLDGKNASNMTMALQHIAGATREVDLKGWYSQNHVLGLILTDTGVAGAEKVREKILSGLRDGGVLGEDADFLKVSCHVFPAAEGADKKIPDDLKLYPDIVRKSTSKKKALALKRALDIAGSIAGLIIFSPLFVVIPALVKLTSRGPVFFRQQRVGNLGQPFTFLKFRSMRTGASESIHSEYIKKLIHEDSAWQEAGEKVFKISDDPRVTAVGRFLRKTSLDELPQFINVLRGDMSLVGPRPPIPYELDYYELWHFRRVMEAKPGLTGLWQVSGRSRKTYNEMVRLDIRYIEGWSLWLDLKIILLTPFAMISSKDAY